MAKKEHKKEEKPENLVMPKGQMLRLKKLFSIGSGKKTNAVDPSRLN